MTRPVVVLFSFCSLLLAGCAATLSSQEASYKRGLGEAYPEQAATLVPDILVNQYGYALYRRVNTVERKFFKTEWKQHVPNEQEQRKNIRTARTRIIVRGRPANRSGDGPQEYRVQFEAKYQVKRDTTDWVFAEMGERRAESIEEIARELETEFRSAGF